MKRRLRRQEESFKRGQRNKATVLGTALSSAYVQEARKDPLNPRTTKINDVLRIQSFVPIINFISLRTTDNSWRSIKANPAIASFKDYDNTSRSKTIQVIGGWGNTPSTVLTQFLALTARQIGAIRRYHNPNWRAQGNRYIRRANNLNRFIV
jgi:hypothetical protein